MEGKVAKVEKEMQQARDKWLNYQHRVEEEIRKVREEIKDVESGGNKVKRDKQKKRRLRSYKRKWMR